MLKKLLLLSTVFLISIVQIKAQLGVSNDMTPEQYVQDVLLGDGVTAFNVTFNGMTGDEISDQCSNFEGLIMPNDTLNGVLLSTGGYLGAVGPNDAGGNSEFIEGESLTNDPDLDMIAGVSTFDASILEFDFIPTDDTLKFKYVFASEEYNEYVCGTVNDAFGFFLSGPGIAGPFSSPAAFPDGSKNVALIPDPDAPGYPDDPITFFDIPVSINTVNNGTAGTSGTASNCADLDPNWTDNNVHYIDNTGDTNIQYDGKTIILTALAVVECGETYHIKLAIADGGDGVFDSGVFIQENSFSSQPEEVTLNPNGAEYFVESSTNCDSAYASITRSCGTDSLYYRLRFQGEAEYGIDFTINPPDTTILMTLAETIYEFGVECISDGIPEGSETIELILLSSDSIDGVFEPVDTVYREIIDSYTFELETPNLWINCPTDSAYLNTLPILLDTVPTAPFQYTWTYLGELYSDEGAQIFVPVPPIQWDSAFYNVIAVDNCDQISILDTVTIYNNIPNAPTATVNTDNVYCRSVPYPLAADVTAGTSPFTYEWSDGGNTSPNFVTPFEETEYSVIVTDFCGRETTASGTIIMPTPVVAKSYLQDYICLDEILELSPEASGGRAPYKYTWSFDPNFGNLEYNDDSGQGTVSDLYVDGVDENVIESTLTVKDWCQVQRDLIPVFDPIDQPIVIEETITLLNCLIPNVITPGNGDNLNELFSAEELLAKPGTMFIYDRWGKLMSESSNHTWDADNASDGTYFYVVAFEDGEVKKGSFTILR